MSTMSTMSEHVQPHYRSYLQQGDTIALVCTGTPCDSLDQVEQCRNYLDQRGFNPLYTTSTYLKQSAEQRARDLLAYLLDPHVKMIWSLRGGEGSADLLPFIAPHLNTLKNLEPKLMMGFSDFTPLLVYFQDKLSWPTIHGVGLRQLALNMVSHNTEELTWACLFNPCLFNPSLRPLNCHIHGENIGELIGGNMTLVCLSIGDLWQFSAKGKILLLEEVNEEAYKVRRALNYLMRVGLFDGVLGVIFGGFTLSKPHFAATESEAVQKVLAEFAQNLSVPAYYTAQISHGLENYPVPFYRSHADQQTLARPDIELRGSAQK